MWGVNKQEETMTYSNNNGNGTNGKTRLHIQKQMEDGVSINVFGDNPDEVVALLISTIGLCGGVKDIKPVSLPITQSPSLTKQQTQKQQSVSYSRQSNVCPSCRSGEHVKFIQGTNKGTGKAFARYKCEACNKWL